MFKSNWLIPERLFVTIALIFGILFLTITPPFQVADEYDHFSRAFHISQGHLMAERSGNSYGGMLPKSILKTSAPTLKIPFHPQVKYDPSKTFTLLKLPLKEKKKTFITFISVAKYSPVPYFPQALAIKLGTVVKFSPLMLMYLARAFNLLFFIVLGYFTIRLSPIFKWVFLLLLLTPMALALAASVSADSFTIAISFLLISVLLRSALQDQGIPLSRSEYIAITSLSVLLSLSKPPYQLLVFLFLLIPVKRLGTIRRYFIFFISLLLICTAASLSILYLISSLKDVSYGANMASPAEQLARIKKDPFVFVVAFFNGWLTDGANLIKETIGILGWLDTPLPDFHIYSYIVVLFITAIFGNSEKLKLALGQKTIIFSTFVFNVVAISFLLYVHWSQRNQNIVAGWQGRYLTPISALFLLPLYNQRFRFPQRGMAVFLTCYLLFSGVSTLTVLIHRYYG